MAYDHMGQPIPFCLDADVHREGGVEDVMEAEMSM